MDDLGQSDRWTTGHIIPDIFLLGYIPFFFLSFFERIDQFNNKLLGFLMSGTPKNGDGNPNFLAGFPTGNPGIVR